MFSLCNLEEDSVMKLSYELKKQRDFGKRIELNLTRSVPSLPSI